MDDLINSLGDFTATAIVLAVGAGVVFGSAIAFIRSSF